MVYFAGAHKLGEPAVLALDVSRSAGDDCGVDCQLLGQTYDPHRGKPFGQSACFPSHRRYQGILSQLVSLFLRFVGAVEPQVIYEGRAVVQVESGVGQFVHQDPPEIVYAVVTQGEPDYRSSVLGFHGCAIQVGPWQVWDDFNGDPSVAQKLHSLQRAHPPGC